MNGPVELYACVCVKEFSTQALLRVHPELNKWACVVMDGDPPLQQVCSLNENAQSIGMARGMTQVEAETFVNAAILKRSERAEAAAKAMLLECAGEFSPRVEMLTQDDDRLMCVLDIVGTEKLFGPPVALASKLHSGALAAGFDISVSISHNFHTSAVAAKGLAGGRPIQVIPAGMEQQVLASLPLNALDLTEEQSATFAMWGIRTLGALGDLPEKELIARMGQEGKRLRQLARGERTHLFRPVETEPSLSEHIELDSPVEVLDALLFVANLLLERIIQRVSARILSIASVAITLALEGGNTHTRTVRPALPSNDRQMWLKLLHLDLEAHPPPTAVHAVTLAAEPGKSSKVQLGLFSPQSPEPGRLDVTLARLYSLVGEENVGRAVLDDTHAPEGFHLEPFRVPSTQPDAQQRTRNCLAQRRLRPSEPISVTLCGDRPSVFFFRQIHYRIENAYGPWLTSGEWWKATLWGCEQWDIIARAQNGEMLCGCMVRDVMRNQWQMAALYD